jgi:hypothetical protein
MIDNKSKFSELRFMIEKTLYHYSKSQEYEDLIVEYLKDLGYINDEIIGNIVHEIIFNTNSCKTPQEYMEEIFENLNFEGNF